MLMNQNYTVFEAIHGMCYERVPVRVRRFGEFEEFTEYKRIYILGGYGERVRTHSQLCIPRAYQKDIFRTKKQY